MSTLSFLAKRFVAGENMNAAIIAAQKLDQSGLHCSLDVLGEDVANPQEAVQAAKTYCDLIDLISRHRVRSNVSLKLTQMGLDISPEFCLEQVTKVLNKAKEHHNFVRLDMEGSAYTTRTLDIFHKLYQQALPVGVVIQAYLHRSAADAEKLASVKAPVRVCKGAYKEPSSIAFQSMDDIRASYKQLVQTLIAGGSKVGIATHDDQLIDWAVKWVHENRVPREQFEFQVLYGLKRKRAQSLADLGYTVRIYVPFGTHWFPYFSRRLRERKENVFFVLKSLVVD